MSDKNLREKEKAEEKTSYLCKAEDPAEHRKCSGIVQGNQASKWYQCTCTCHKSEPSSKESQAMSVPAINYHGERLPAFVCKICGALDTDRERLAVHEQRHTIMQAACKVVGKVRVSQQIQCITPGCKQIQKARGLCKRCYARAWARGRIHG